ncbi:MAG: ketopantoate reductase family protein [Mycobacteriales bacterium]
MRFVVLGAGAIGGTIGGRLADAGHDVVLVARGEHLEVLQHKGLRLSMPDRVIERGIPATSVDGLTLTGDDVLLIATKVQDADALLTRVAGLGGADLPVVCAQNGVAGERLALRRFDRVYGMCVMLPATHLEPGRIVAAGAPYSGMLDLGRYPQGRDATADAVAEALEHSGFRSTVRDEIMPWKWAKLLRNVGNAIQVLLGDDRDDEVVRDLDRQSRAEAEQVLAAARIPWTPDPEWNDYRRDQVRSVPVEGTPRGGGSSWQSAVRGLPTVETDYLNGEVVLLGRMHGVPTPVNALLQREANALVRRGDPPGSVRAAELLSRL